MDAFMAVAQFLKFYLYCGVVCFYPLKPFMSENMSRYQHKLKAFVSILILQPFCVCRKFPVMIWLDQYISVVEIVIFSFLLSFLCWCFVEAAGSSSEQMCQFPNALDKSSLNQGRIILKFRTISHLKIHTHSNWKWRLLAGICNTSWKAIPV